MSSIQQLLLGAGSASKKTYLDDVFSTYLYTGNASDKTITNGIDLAGEGGLTWIKRRNSTSDHALVDTVRGASQYLSSNSTAANVATGANNNFNSFTSTGFTLKDDNGNDYFNKNNTPYSSWSFRKTSGFFDVKTFTWNGSSGGYTTLAVNHDLKSVPGMVIIKSTNGQSNWRVYHRDLGTGDNKMLALNTGDAAHGFNTGSNNNHFVSVTDTAVTFKSLTNTISYVMYVFAGGESTAATARSVDFDGSGDYLKIDSHADLVPSTGAFTLEMWIKPNSWDTNDTLWYTGISTGLWIKKFANNNQLFVGQTNGTGQAYADWTPPLGLWSHLAVTRDSSNNLRIFVNGLLQSTAVASTDYGQNDVYLGWGGGDFDGEMSNVRFIKGTALYTSSFRPPTEPLTDVTNTKLLCCNGSSTTSSTVTPSTITAGGSITASTDSPFDDPAGFVFGDAEDQNVIKCGSYVGSGSNDLEVNVGFEPSYVLLKNSSSADNWYVLDSMRGFIDNGGDNDIFLCADLNQAENGYNFGELTPTGFRLYGSSSANNASGSTYIYMCIRRSDPLVQKPAELGTDVFAMDTGTGSATIPNFDSGFPVDFAIYRHPASTGDWWVNARLMHGKELKTSSTDALTTYSGSVFDSNTGWNTGQASSAKSWMWKRHAGFDVVTYDGNAQAGRAIPHNLSKTPEMIWLKSTSHTFSWVIGHKALDGGTNSWEHNLYFDTNDETDYPFWNDTAPTATHFTVGSDNYVNDSYREYLAVLFASVDGISKVGSYDGSTSNVAVNIGFQPRFIILKKFTGSSSWAVFDSLRGMGSGNDQYLRLESTVTQYAYDYLDISSTGFTITENDWRVNGQKYIYYAHA